MEDQIKAKGATLVAITPQLPANSQKMVEQHSLGFDLLRDPGNDYSMQLGLRFQVDGELKETYSAFGINLPVHNGEDSWTLPMPGRFVIDSGGVIRAVDVDPDYTHRPEPQSTLDVLAAL